MRTRHRRWHFPTHDPIRRTGHCASDPGTNGGRTQRTPSRSCASWQATEEVRSGSRRRCPGRTCRTCRRDCCDDTRGPRGRSGSHIDGTRERSGRARSTSRWEEGRARGRTTVGSSPVPASVSTAFCRSTSSASFEGVNVGSVIDTRETHEAGAVFRSTIPSRRPSRDVDERAAMKFEYET